MKKYWDGVVTVGSVEVGAFQAEYETSQDFRPQNYRMVCPCCGDAWARLEMKLASSYAVMVAPCQDCGGGVLWLYFGSHRQKTPFKFEGEVLKRDFMILSDAFLNDKKLHEQTRIHLL